MDPRQVGGRYFCGYWQQEYTVTAMWTEEGGVQWFTCEWEAGHSTSHCTRWDERRDCVVASPTFPVR